VEDNIDDVTSEVRYSFDARAGNTINLTMSATSGNLNPLIILFNPDGTEIIRSENNVEDNRNDSV
jgi:hypothetical protein